MFATPSHLPESARARIVEKLNASLADGIDLYSQVKVAHWNIKGPHFIALHELFDAIATSWLRSLTWSAWCMSSPRCRASTTTWRSVR